MIKNRILVEYYITTYIQAGALHYQADITLDVNYLGKLGCSPRFSND